MRLIVTNWIAGAALGAIAAALVLAFDIFGLRGMLIRGEVVWEGLVLLFGGFAVTFGGVVCGSAVMHVPCDAGRLVGPNACTAADTALIRVHSRERMERRFRTGDS